MPSAVSPRAVSTWRSASNFVPPSCCKREPTAGDIDHVKRINDTHGHAVGDQVLIDFAGLLQSMAREAVDSVIRYGGEEFLIVLPQTELAGAQALAERIRAAFANASTAAGDATLVRATASFGVASVPPMNNSTRSSTMGAMACAVRS